MKNIFQQYETDRPVRSQHLNNLKVFRVNQETFRTNSLTLLGPKIWNNLPIHLKCIVKQALSSKVCDSTRTRWHTPKSL